MMNEDILKRFDELMGLGNQVLATITPATPSVSACVDRGIFRGFRSASLSFLERIFGANQTYYKEFIENVEDVYPSETDIGINILKVAKAEIEGGWLFTVEGRVSAEIFADFIALAKEALDDNKDVAAVLSCAALEDALKRVAIKAKLDLDDKGMSEVINALKAEGVIKGERTPIDKN